MADGLVQVTCINCGGTGQMCLGPSLDVCEDCTNCKGNGYVFTATIASVEERVVQLLNEALATYILDTDHHAAAVQSIIAELIHQRLLRRYAEEEHRITPATGREERR